MNSIDFTQRHFEHNYGNVNGWKIIEKEKVDNYDLCLIYFPMKVFDNCDGLYQIGLQQHGLDYNFQENKLKNIQPNIKAKHIPYHKFIKILQLWIKKYHRIVFSSRYINKIESYNRIMKKMGFTIEEIEIFKQRFYVAF